MSAWVLCMSWCNQNYPAGAADLDRQPVRAAQQVNQRVPGVRGQRRRHPSARSRVHYRAALDNHKARLRLPMSLQAVAGPRLITVSAGRWVRSGAVDQ